MPVREKGEDLSTYIKRCVPIRQSEHPDEDVKQSTAICYSMGREYWKPKKKGLLEK